MEEEPNLFWLWQTKLICHYDRSRRGTVAVQFRFLYHYHNASARGWCTVRLIHTDVISGQQICVFIGFGVFPKIMKNIAPENNITNGKKYAVSYKFYYEIKQKCYISLKKNEAIQFRFLYHFQKASAWGYLVHCPVGPSGLIHTCIAFRQQ